MKNDFDTLWSKWAETEKMSRDLGEERRKINERLEWLFKFSSNRLVEIGKDKFGHTVLVTSDEILLSKFHSGVNITLYDLWSRDHVCRLDGDIQAGGPARLVDITGEENRGYGSMALDYFIQLCKKYGAKQVTGTLSWVARGNSDRSERFYSRTTLKGTQESINKGRAER